MFKIYIQPRPEHDFYQIWEIGLGAEQIKYPARFFF